jgi:hypothetical protein
MEENVDKKKFFVEKEEEKNKFTLIIEPIIHPKVIKRLDPPSFFEKKNNKTK